MTTRRNSAAARVIPVSADPDTISESGSSTSVPPPQPWREQTYSVSQVVRAGAPVIPTPEAVAVEEMARQVVVEGSARAVAGAAISNYLRTYGLIPLTCSEGRRRRRRRLDLDLNALAPPDAIQPPPRVDPPVICAYCNCAFCFAEHEVPYLDLGPGHAYPAPPAPIALNLLTPPAVGPLYRDGDPRAPEWLLVCSSEYHFMVTMGMLQQQQPGGAPPLEWKCTPCLRVLPIVAGSDGASSSDLHAYPAPPPEPWTYAGAYWNYVVPGHEDMVKLKLHDDPLKLCLGRR